MNTPETPALSPVPNTDAMIATSSPVGWHASSCAKQIVPVAACLFANIGYHQVGMRDIADALGIRGASLYHHYHSKEDILYAICLTEKTSSTRSA